MNTYHIYTPCMSPTRNGSSVLERFEHGNAIKIRNGIMFDFYPGLSHVICLLCSLVGDAREYGKQCVLQNV